MSGGELAAVIAGNQSRQRRVPVNERGTGSD